MLLRDHDIKNLALYAPRFAYGLIAGVPRVPFVGDFPVQFTSAAIDAPPIVASLTNNLTQDTLVERVSFSLWQPGSFVGSPFAAQYFAKLKQCPGVGVQCAVFGGPKYNVNDDFTELADFADILAITWPQGWPLYRQSNVKMSFILTETPASVPYDVRVTLLGWQWLDKCLDDLSDAECRARLRKLGLDVPDLATLLKP